MAHFHTIGLITKPNDQSLIDTVRALLDVLSAKSVEVVLDSSAANLLQKSGVKAPPRAVMATRCDLAIVVGGDGTFLNAARSLAVSDVPLLGINRGRLGFLVDISPEDMAHQLDEILAGRYRQEYRFLLHTRIIRNSEIITQSDALNDVVVHVREVVRMIEFDTYIDGHFLNTQRADGLIVATPTGSTAYALSGGGPILHPSLEAIVLVSICSHTLTNRPIVIDAKSQIEVVICQQHNQSARVSFDGQDNVDLLPHDRLQINRLPYVLRLIQPREHDYFEILRAKLHWGEQL
jgi:NAD+ kinase